MAKFEMEVPNELIKQFQTLSDNCEEIFGEMTKAGAEVVAKNMAAAAPSQLKPYIITTKTYKTPSDGGINTKVMVSGYIPFSNPNRVYFTRSGGNGKSYSTPKGVPADFLAQLYEYGRSSAPWPKRPFMRKSFKKDEIAEAMSRVQNKMYRDIFGAEDFVNERITGGWK